ncbi:MAG: hypothetical protein JWP50_2644 [Phenylobacterium sp.]|nr:hypothetical protein [Phenylobacterium sp.]
MLRCGRWRLRGREVLEALLDLVDPVLGSRSGSVFYSGRSAFSEPNDLYLLGLNPGGSPSELAADTIERHIQEAIKGRTEWSAYEDESWQGKLPGTYGMQPRVLHLLRQLGRNPRKTPASNVAFVRTRREADLNREKADLLKSCWPVHQAVIEELRVRVVICFGGTAGAWVRQELEAHEEAARFTEDNQRRWTSHAHRNCNGLCVLTLTHPSIAKWNTAATDPTPLVRRMLEERA